MSNAGDLFYIWGRGEGELNLQGLNPGSKRESRIHRRLSTSSIKRCIRRFHVVVVQWTSKKRTKKLDASAGLLFCS